MTRIAIIPARGGSVRIPRKNVRPFMGKPMLQWPIEAAHASKLFDRVIVSTDDGEIAKLALELNCGVHMRAADDGSMGTQELSTRVLEFWRDHLSMAADEACVIYPCSPLLTADDLRSSHAALTPVSQWVMSWLYEANADAGCFYWGRAWSFYARRSLEQLCWRVLVDESRFIDINTPQDWARAESMFNALHP